MQEKYKMQRRRFDGEDRKHAEDSGTKNSRWRKKDVNRRLESKKVARGWGDIRMR